MELGLSSREFYSMTPRQFDALTRAHRRSVQRKIEHTEFMFAQLTAMVANTGFRGWKDARTTDEFMPSRYKQAPAKAQRINRKAIAEQIRSNMRFLMATQNKGA